MIDIILLVGIWMGLGALFTYDEIVWTGDTIKQTIFVWAVYALLLAIFGPVLKLLFWFVKSI